MGGGTAYIPILTQLLGVPQRLAQWANLVAFVPMAAASLAIHAKNKLLDKRGFWWLVLPSGASCVACSMLAVKASPRYLAIAFALLLIVMGIIGLGGTVVKARKEKRMNTPHEPDDLP